MIKKNTKIIFKDDDNSSELIGGIPLSTGEIIHLHKNNLVVDYIVQDKKIDIILENDDQIVNITYTLEKK